MNIPPNVRAEEWYDKFLIWSSWQTAIAYAVPGVTLITILELFSIPVRFWTPILIVYAVGAVSHQLIFGFRALAIRMKVCADYAVDTLVKVDAARTSGD